MTPQEITLSLCVCGKPDCFIEKGYCHCGCGELAPIADRNKASLPFRKGERKIYIHNHHSIKRPVIEDALPFKINGIYCRLIALTQGQYTIVYESDYRWLMQWKWQADWNKATRSYYAKRSVRVNGKQGQIKMHRLILGLANGDPRESDHENLNTLDNRRSNLRLATSQQNSCNQRMRQNNKCGYKGVHQHKNSNKWAAQIQANGEGKWLGEFDTPEEAYQKYCEAAKDLHGEFARLK